MDLDPKAVVTIVTMLFGASVCWSAAFAWAKWLGRPRPATFRDDAAPHLPDRLRAIEHTLEAVALEVERISEGQRFTTRLLGERPATAAPSARGPAELSRVPTPH